jgi:ankyrin repeat protein
MKNTWGLLSIALVAQITALLASDVPANATRTRLRDGADSFSTVIDLLWDATPAEQQTQAEVIMAHGDRFAPPVLCVVGAVLARETRMDDAMFWFYAGQLRTRFDVNRCANKDVGNVAYLMKCWYGSAIERYAFSHPAALKTVLRRVLEWDVKAPYDYDPHWVDARAKLDRNGVVVNPDTFQERTIPDPALGNCETVAVLVDEKLWPDIAKKTREDFRSELRFATGDNPEDYFSDPKVVALTRAATAGDVATIDALVRQGLDVNAVGKGDITPLWFAYVSGNRAGFVHLLDLSADPARPIQIPNTSVVDSAVERDDDEFLTLLLEHKLNPDRMSMHNQGPLLHRVVTVPSKLRLLVEHGANVNVQDGSGCSAIKHAADYQAWDSVLYLLEHGADPAVRDPDGFDIARSLFERAGIPGENEAKRRQVIAKLTELGYKFDGRVLARARPVHNPKEATDATPVH